MGIQGGVHSKQTEQRRERTEGKEKKIKDREEGYSLVGMRGGIFLLHNSLSWSCRVCFGFLYFAACHTSVLPTMFPAEGKAMLCISFGSLSYRLLRPPRGAASYAE
jgi:hypothetical protein